MRDIIIMFIVFSLLPVTVWRPWVGILLWSWLGYMNPHRLTWSFAFDFPFAQLTAIATLAGFFFYRDRKGLPINTTTVVWLLFIAWMAFTTIFALNMGEAPGELMRTAKIQLFAFLTIFLMQTPERVKALVWVIVLSLGFFGFKGGLYTIISGSQYLVWGPAGSFIADNNALALALIMTLPLAWFLFAQTRSRILKLGLAFLMALSCLSILGSHSRGAALAGATMTMFLWAKSRNKLGIGLAILVLLPVFVASMPQEWFQRMETIKTYEQDESAMGRIHAWEFAIDMANSRPIGGGYDVFVEENYRKYAPEITAIIDKEKGRFQGPHSIYFRVLGEHGYFGLTLFLLLGFSAYFTGSYVIRRARNLPGLTWASDLAAMLQTSLVGFAVGGAFLGLSYFDFYYHLISLLVVLRAIVDTETAKLRTGAVGESPLPIERPGLHATRAVRPDASGSGTIPPA